MHVLTHDNWRKLVTALATIEPCTFTGTREDQIKVVLGEVGDIWPASILDDVVGDEPDRRARLLD